MICSLYHLGTGITIEIKTEHGGFLANMVKLNAMEIRWKTVFSIYYQGIYIKIIHLRFY